MKLILTEYINSLKEDGELDQLIQDILVAHNVEIFSVPERGRQYGVDIYANGHKGVAIGLRIDEQAYRVRDIQYLPNLISIEDVNNIDTMSILCSKINLWSYENEVRAFTTDNSLYINVIVEEIYLGSRMSNQDISFIRSLVEKINPNIRVIRARN